MNIYNIMLLSILRRVNSCSCLRSTPRRPAGNRCEVRNGPLRGLSRGFATMLRARPYQLRVVESITRIYLKRAAGPGGAFRDLPGR